MNVLRYCAIVALLWSITAGAIDFHGSFRGYSYGVTRGEGVYSAHFDPPLGRSDAIAVAMMVELVKVTYDERLDAPAPRIVERRGRRWIALRGRDGLYLFLLIKDERGQVMGMGYQREP